MTPEPHFTGDLAAVPTHAFGHRSLTWWGVIAYMAIEGAFFVLAAAAYFFLMNQEASWAPGRIRPPELLAGTLFTLVMLASEIPNSIVKKAAESHRLRTVQVGLLVVAAFGLVLLALRAFEFGSLNVRWTDNPYGSVLWMLLVLHTVHVSTDWVDTLVLTALMFTPQMHEPRRLVDTSENSLYWRFVWLTWLPLYLLIYWLPRWSP